jgi:hypothetical protein
MAQIRNLALLLTSTTHDLRHQVKAADVVDLGVTGSNPVSHPNQLSVA